MSQPIIFICHSHKDEKEKEELVAHLRVLQYENLIDLWSDDQIAAGADWKQETSEVIERARVVILLISANFLTSDFILDKEIPSLLKRREREGLTIFPVIARACAWKRVGWLTEMRVRPNEGRPIWGADSGVDKDLAAIAEEVAAIIKPISHIAPTAASITARENPRSNNINIGGSADRATIIGGNVQGETVIFASRVVNLAPSPPSLDKLIQQAMSLLDFANYDKVVEICFQILKDNPYHSETNLLAGIALMDGKSADKVKESIIVQIEKHLKVAIDDPITAPTALAVLGIIKYDYFVADGLFEGAPRLNEVKQQLQGKQGDVNAKLLGHVQASESVLALLNLIPG